jgi:hypothetical protein
MMPRAAGGPVVIDLGVVGRLPSDDLVDANPDMLVWSPTPPRPRHASLGALMLAVLACAGLVGSASPTPPGLTELYAVQMTRGWYALDADVFYLVTGSGEVTAFGLADGLPRWRTETGRVVAFVDLPETGPPGPLAVHWQGFCPGLTRIDPATGTPLWSRPGSPLGGTGDVMAILRSSDVGCDTRDVRSPTSVSDVVEVVDVVDDATGTVRRSLTIGYRGRWVLGPDDATIATWDPRGHVVERDLTSGAELAAGEVPELADPPPGRPARLPPPSLSGVGDVWVVLTPTPPGSPDGTVISAYDRHTLSPRWTVKAPAAHADGRVRYGARPCGAAVCVVLGGVANLVLDPATGAELGRFADGAVPLGTHPYGVLTTERPEGGPRDVLVDRRTGAPVRGAYELRGMIIGDTGVALLSRPLRGGVEFASFDLTAGRWRDVGTLPGFYGRCSANRAYLLCVDSHLAVHVFRQTRPF